MSARGQTTLIQHLTDPDAIEAIVREGLPEDCLPSEQLRRVYAWSVDYWHRSGRLKAPSDAVLVAEFGDVLSDHEIDLVEPEDSVEWALDDLKGGYVHRQTADLQKRLAVEMSEAETAERIEVVRDYSTELVALALEVARADEVVDAREAMAERLMAYEARSAGDAITGARLGLPEVDVYTGGVHPGELLILAAGPKVGKSFMLNYAALREWESGRAVVLFTLENSVEMTLDRIASLAARIDPMAWQRGESTEDDIAAVRAFHERLSASPTPLWVIHPAPGERTAEQMVRQAQVLGADTLLIDQLTFIEHPNPARKTRQEVVRDITHALKSLISTGRDRMPCILAHQINREGVKAAAKDGRHEMTHLAESSEVERTADWVMSLYQGSEYAAVNRIFLQTLASRRAPIRNYDLDWDIASASIGVLREVVDTMGARFGTGAS